MPLLTTGAGKYAAGGAAAYDPAADAGLKAWYKADSGPRDSGNAVPDDVEAVNTWLDSSGSGATLTYSGSNPLALTYTVNSLNSLPGVTQLGGAGLISANNPFSLTATQLTCLILMKSITGGASLGDVFSVYGDGQTNSRNNTKSFSIFKAGTADENLVTGYANNDYLVSPDGWAEDMTPGTARVFAVQFTGTHAHVYSSGSEWGTGQAWTSAIGDTVVKTLNMFGGAGGTDNSRATIYEVILTTTVLALGSSGPVGTYFTNKWGVY